MVRNGVVVDFGYINGMPATVSFNGNTFYYVTNGQGDVTGITDSTGNLQITYYYDAWGTAYCTYNTATSPYAQSLYDLNPLLYRGYVFDREAGMYYLQSRYYIPSIGRLLNADGLVSTGQGILGNNMFAYCESNPVNAVDHTGMLPWFIDCIIAIVEKATDKKEQEPFNFVTEGHKNVTPSQIVGNSFWGTVESSTTASIQDKQHGLFYGRVDYGEDCSYLGRGINLDDYVEIEAGLGSDFSTYRRLQLTPWFHGGTSFGLNGASVSVGVDVGNVSRDIEFTIGPGAIAFGFGLYYFPALIPFFG